MLQKLTYSLIFSSIWGTICGLLIKDLLTLLLCNGIGGFLISILICFLFDRRNQ